MIKIVNIDGRIFTVLPNGRKARWEGLYSSEVCEIKDLEIVQVWEG